MSKEIIIASHNRDKIREFQELLPQFTIRGAFEFGLVEPDETGATFAENAEIKARYFFTQTNIACIADDSGLSVPAIDNMPGVYSARWAINKDFTPAMDKLRVMVAGMVKPRAFFSCALCYIDHQRIIHADGRVDGHLTFPPNGNLGFGYDPVFIPDGDSRTFGAMTLAEKNKYSHRVRALNDLQAKIALNI